jgi:hypothetical protein
MINMQLDQVQYLKSSHNIQHPLNNYAQYDPLDFFNNKSERWPSKSQEGYVRFVYLYASTKTPFSNVSYYH